MQRPLDSMVLNFMRVMDTYWISFCKTAVTGEQMSTAALPENRARLLFQALESVLAVWSSSQVGIRISPSTQFNGMSDSNPTLIFDYVAANANKYSLAYLHIIEPRINGSIEIGEGLPPVAAVELGKTFPRANPCRGWLRWRKRGSNSQRRSCGSGCVWPFLHCQSRSSDTAFKRVCRSIVMTVTHFTVVMLTDTRTTLSLSRRPPKITLSWLRRRIS